MLRGAYRDANGNDYALFAPALAVVLLIFTGIQNAWDVVTYLATGKAETSPGRAANTRERTNANPEARKERLT